jgi:hypothetical protein
MRLSSLLTVAAAWATMVEANLSAPVPLSPHAPSPEKVNETRASKGERANNLVARAWNPSKVANDEMWKDFIRKGQRLKYLMEAPDKGAGFLLGDARKPPSAASKWPADLTGLYSELISGAVVTDMCEKMLFASGIGTRAQ